MARSRPGILTAAAISAFVMGGLGVLCGICGVGAGGVVIMMASSAKNNSQMADFNEYMQLMDKEAPGWEYVEVGKPAIVLFLAIILIIAGIGLMNVHSWARWTCVAYGLITILLHSGYLAYEFVVVVPATEARSAQEAKVSSPFGRPAPATTQSPSQKAGSVVGALVAGVLYILHAGVLIVMMFAPGVGAAFAGKSSSYRDDDEDVDEDRPKRRRRRADDYED